MKTIYYLFFLLLCPMSNIICGQTPNWSWVKHPISSTYSYNYSKTCTDASGYVYITGSFSDTITFGAYTLKSQWPDPQNGADIYLAKYDSSGNVIWATCWQGREFDQGDAICTDPAGNIYIGGRFKSDFISSGPDTLMNPSPGDGIFIMKYNSSGQLLWTRVGGANFFAYQSCYSISTDSLGYIYASGNFGGYYIAFNTDTLYAKNVSLGGHMFLIKYDSSGNVIWGQAIEAGNIYSKNDNTGNTFIAGEIVGSPIIIGDDTINNLAGINTYIAKVDVSGNFLWGKTTIGDGSNYVRAINSDDSNNLYISGKFQGTYISFDSFTLHNHGLYDGYLVKYSSNGSVVWAKQVGGPGETVISDIAKDTYGHLYVTGFFDSSYTVFNSDTLRNSVQTSVQTTMFVAKYNMMNGYPVWVQSSMPGGGDFDQQITSDVNGNVYAVGQIRYPYKTFGRDTIFDTISAVGIYVAKIGTTNPTTGIHQNLKSSDVIIYPNPSTGIVYFTGVELGYTISVYNLLGEIVRSGQVDSSEFGMNLSSQASGIYICKVIDNKGQVHERKIIKE
ncbi:MAG: hypothetical protein JWO03_1760 [Bacteroidetes bacterium]|nr:hypothetical protein [Bacteroidota bacterium]